METVAPKKKGKGVKVHVNRNVIASNLKHGKNDPPITIRRSSKKTERGHKVKLIGEATMIYSPDKPLSCGARLWIQADGAEIIE